MELPSVQQKALSPVLPLTSLDCSGQLYDSLICILNIFGYFPCPRAAQFASHYHDVLRPGRQLLQLGQGGSSIPADNSDLFHLLKPTHRIEIPYFSSFNLLKGCQALEIS